MGYGDDEGTDDEGMEAELAAILGAGSSPKPQTKKKAPKC